MGLEGRGVLCRCGCGRELVKHDYETLKHWEKRKASGLYRAKCRKNLPTAPKVERSKPSLELLSCNYSRGEMVEQEKEKRVEDEKYLEWVRTLPCLVPGCGYTSEAHHQNEKGHGGKGTRASDYRAIPVCFWHHTMGGTVAAPGSYHGMGKLTGWKFWKHSGVDVETVIHDLNRAWLESGKKFKEQWK